MIRKTYQSMNSRFHVNRRAFLKISGVAASAGILLGNPLTWAEGKEKKEERTKPKTNIDQALRVPRKPESMPGPFPGKVVEVHDPAAMPGGNPDARVIKQMFNRGIQGLTGADLRRSFGLLFNKNDVVGIKVNPVGAGLISTRLELVDAIVAWLTVNGVKRNNIIIWDRFESMLLDGGFTPERYPGIGIEGLQIMDMAAYSGEAEDNSGWLNEKGRHISAKSFDAKEFYWADVEGPKDEQYLNQHVFNGKYSNFGKLVTEKLTKIINVPVFKNTGNGVSMATKNIGYGAIANTGRLHQPLFFDVCTEVLAFPCIRDKMVLNIIDGLRGQYEGGPMPAADFTWEFNRLFFATDPFAVDMVGHRMMVEKRKEMQIRVNEHPMFTEYLHYGERLGLGIADPERIQHIVV